MVETCHTMQKDLLVYLYHLFEQDKNQALTSWNMETLH